MDTKPLYYTSKTKFPNTSKALHVHKKQCAK